MAPMRMHNWLPAAAARSNAVARRNRAQRGARRCATFPPPPRQAARSHDQRAPRRRLPIRARPKCGSSYYKRHGKTLPWRHDHPTPPRGRNAAERFDPLGQFILLSELALDLPGDLPDALSDLERAPEDRKEIVYACCDQMRGSDSAKAGYGESYLLITILAAVLGGTSPAGGFDRVAGLVLSLAILQILASGLNLLRVSGYLTIAIWGATILAVAAVRRRLIRP